MFNPTEGTMSKRGLAAAQAQRELEWRDRLARQVASRQSITAFCRSEGIAEGTFYGWRARLRARPAAAEHSEPTAEGPAAFVDIGTVKGLEASPSAKPAHDRPKDPGGKIEVRIDLGCGLMLQIVRH
jgi:transposase-like protein